MISTPLSRKWSLILSASVVKSFCVVSRAERNFLPRQNPEPFGLFLLERDQRRITKCEQPLKKIGQNNGREVRSQSKCWPRSKSHTKAKSCPGTVNEPQLIAVIPQMLLSQCCAYCALLLLLSCKCDSKQTMAGIGVLFIWQQWTSSPCLVAFYAISQQFPKRVLIWMWYLRPPHIKDVGIGWRAISWASFLRAVWRFEIGRFVSVQASGGASRAGGLDETSSSTWQQCCSFVPKPKMCVWRVVLAFTNVLTWKSDWVL